MSDHCLLIEQGRYKKIPREERLCQKCKQIEDEIHFFFYCQKNKALRESYIEYLTDENMYFLQLSDYNKLKYILSPSSQTQVNKLGSFLKQSIELRTGDS